jgi:hypothetical protein
MRLFVLSAFSLALVGCSPPGAGDVEICDDQLDGDGDGAVDCEDEDCAGFPACQPEANCSDGADEDEDGAVDCTDPDCSGDPACLREICFDGVDNDRDGAADCDDSECAALSQCLCEGSLGEEIEFFSLDPRTVEGDTTGAGDLIDSICRDRAATEVVFLVEPAFDGALLIEVESAADLGLDVKDVCGEGFALLCTPGKELEVREGRRDVPFLLFVGGLTAGDEGPFTLTITPQ